MREIVKGSTSISQEIVLRDSTTGLGKTGLIFSDITGSYTRNRAARTAITMATLASASAAWSSGGFVEIDATNCPGLYRFDVPDAAFATGVRTVTISAKATGVITEHLQFILTGWDPQDAVHGGLSALPNAAAGATGGLACLVAFGGTATAGAASTVTLPSPASTVADFYKGLEVSIIGGTGIGQSRIITTYSTGRVATVDRAWATNPDNTSVVEVRDIASPPLDSSLQVAVGTVGTGAIVAGSYAVDAITSGALSNGAVSEIAAGVWDEARSGHTTAGSFGQGVASVQGNVTGSAASVTGAVGSVASGGITSASFAASAINAAAIATDAITAAKIAADAIGASELAADAVTEIQAAVAAGSVASVVGAVGSVTGNVGGNVVGSIGSIATGGIVAGSYAVDAITSAALSNGAVTEIQAGLATAATQTSISSAVAAVQADTDDIQARLPAALSGGKMDSVITGGVTVTTNNDKTGYALTSGERTSIADALLDRDMATGTDTGTESIRTVRQALRFLRNKWTLISGVLTVYKENDTTASWTAAPTLTPGATPITGNDPS